MSSNTERLKYLTADERFSIETLNHVKESCSFRLDEKQKGAAYHRFLDWTPSDNEIALFIWYPYETFKIPKAFNCFFNIEKPTEFIVSPATIIQSVHECWLPIESVDVGYKHLCVFRFEETIPSIVEQLFTTKWRKQAPPSHTFLLVQLGLNK